MDGAHQQSLNTPARRWNPWFDRPCVMQEALGYRALQSKTACYFSKLCQTADFQKTSDHIQLASNAMWNLYPYLNERANLDTARREMPVCLTALFNNEKVIPLTGGQLKLWLHRKMLPFFKLRAYMKLQRNGLVPNLRLCSCAFAAFCYFSGCWICTHPANPIQRRLQFALIATSS